MGSIVSINIMPITGHDLYFMPSSVINYYKKYLSESKLDHFKSHSFKDLGQSHLFTNTLRLDL